jgi:hypothetical protein
MFRATLCSSSGGQLYEYNFWYNHSVIVAVRYTAWPLSQSDYTRSCIHTVVLLRTSTELLETDKRNIEEIVRQVGCLPELAKIRYLNTYSFTIKYDISANFDQEHFNIVQVMVSRVLYL